MLREPFKYPSHAKWFIAIVLSVLVIWGLTDVRSRARLDPAHPELHMTDLTVYTVASAAILDGRDPYSAPNIRDWYYTYPPIFAIILAPLSFLDPQWQAVIWFGINLLLMWGCITETRRIWEWLSYDAPDGAPMKHILGTPWIVWVLGATVTIPAVNCLQRGQVGIVLVYLLLLGSRLVFSGRSFLWQFLGGITLALPIAIKVLPALPVLFACFLMGLAAIFQRTKPTLVRAVATSLGVVLGLLLFILVIPSMVVGPQTNLEYLQTFSRKILLNEGGESDANIAPHTLRNQSLENAVYRLGNFGAYLVNGGPDDRVIDGPPTDVKMPMDAHWVAPATLLLKLMLGALLMMVAIVATGRAGRMGLMTAFSLSWMMMIVISPVFRGHYYVLWWLPVWLVPLYFMRTGRVTLAYGLGISAVALTMVYYSFLGVAGRVGLLGIGATVWYVVATVQLLRTKPASLQKDGKSPGLDQVA